MRKVEEIKEIKPYTKGIRLKNRYRIERAIASGGQGDVYLAWDEQKEVSVAIKVAAYNLKEEARLLNSLKGIGTPRVFALFEEDQVWHLVMEYIEGSPLNVYLEARGALPAEEVLTLGIALSEILESLHSARPPVVHGDIKPGNIIVNPEGEIYVVDFGIAEESTTSAPSRVRRIVHATEGYAPPERREAIIIPEGDVYSLGKTMYQAFTGEVPPRGPRQFFFRPLEGSLGRLMMQMMDRKADKRPDSRTVRRILQILQFFHRVSVPFPFLKGLLGQDPLLCVATALPKGKSRAVARRGLPAHEALTVPSMKRR